MRTLIAIVALAVGMLVFAILPAAAAREPVQKATGALAERIQDLNLTDEQEAQIATIRKEHKTKVQEAAKGLAALVKEEVEKVRGVLTPAQVTKLDAAKEERHEFKAERLAERIVHLEDLDLTDGEMTKFMEIRKEYRPKIEKAMTQLDGLLTDIQRKAREEGLKAGKKRKEILASLKLTDEQKATVETVGKELRTLVREELDKMRDVLSESQKEKIQEFKDERREHVRDHMAHRIMNFKDLNLTDDQKNQIMAIRKDFRPRVHEAGNRLRATVREEVEAIMAVLKG
jgi:Spy/CpxP family protein refolding chaperone